MSRNPIDPVNLNKQAQKRHLSLMGTLAVAPDDPVPAETRSIALFGPHEPGFWEAFKQTPEYLDGRADPMDRWSANTIGVLANAVGGTPLFPFTKPALPFVSWALRSGRAWGSPVAMLVHDQAGLFVSFRGAIALPQQVIQSRPQERPCNACSAPCATACPVGALRADRYDLRACHDYLDTMAGQDCMQNGCAARRVCPISKTSGRLSAQSAFHMGAFHR